MTTMTQPTRITVADAVAAGLCWLARWRGGKAQEITDQVGYYHRSTCRFCTMPLEELLPMTDLTRCSKEELSWWISATKSTRAARIFEAQEPPWWDKLP